jgi:hypothetical protein
MVLVEASTSLRLADVLVSCHLALDGRDNPLELSGVKKAAVLVVDGLGAANLRERAGHARGLMSAWSTRNLSADSGFPSTTASALTSLTTGQPAGQHGIAGYTIRDPDSGEIINHLKSWRPHVNPDTWQRSATVFESAAQTGIPSLALGESRFTGSDFTQATWRGAQFVGVSSLAAQGEQVRDFFDANERALGYLYWPALDRTGHSSGVASDAWIHRLEELDGEIEKLHQLLQDDEGLIVTSDHGMLDVPTEHKLILAEGSPLLEGIVGWAGEPRAPQLYFNDPVARDDARAMWSEALGSAAKVMTKEQIIDEQWMGPVHAEVAPRLGDLVVACVDSLVVYRESLSSPTSMAMVGQHGSLTTREREIPIIPLGAWA